MLPALLYPRFTAWPAVLKRHSMAGYSVVEVRLQLDRCMNELYRSTRDAVVLQVGSAWTVTYPNIYTYREGRQIPIDQHTIESGSQ